MRAAFLTRFCALVVDAAFLAGVFLLIYFVAGTGYMIGARGVSFGQAVRGAGALPVLACAFVYCFYLTYLTMHGRQTIGKSMFAIRVTRRAGEPLGACRALLRCLFYWVSAVPFLWGFLLAVVLNGRAIHDILAGTVVVEEGP